MSQTRAACPYPRRVLAGVALVPWLMLLGCPPADGLCDDSDASDDFLFASCADVARAGPGGWTLISARQEDQGALFGDELCLSPNESCSGHLRDPGACHPDDGQILLSTGDGDYWLVVSSNAVLRDFLSRRRELFPENHCNEPHFCELLPEPLQVVAHSSNFEPLATQVASLWVMSGGLALRAADGRVMAALNLAPYDDAGGALYISSVNAGQLVGDVVAGAPGALFYRCQAARP